jgi:hypothetical protein
MSAGRVLGWGSAAAVLALAALSVLLPFEPVFDPWAWLIWGRDLAGGGLDTSAGASWKPLPVFLTTPYSLAGDAAPELWLITARAGWLAAALLAGRLAWRLTRAAGGGTRAGWAAAVLAACAVVLLEDAFTPWLRQFAGGLSEPLLVAMVLGAIECHLAGRRLPALALLTAASLVRPEAWPFLAGYAIWLGRRGQAPWAALAGAGALVAIAWFAFDLFGSGSPISGAERARVDDEGPLTNGLEALWRAFALAPAALVAALCLWLAARRLQLEGRPPVPPEARVLAALAAAWVGVVFAMALVGYAALPRFSSPAGALACVLGASALVLFCSRLAWSSGPPALALVAVVLVAGAGAQMVVRAAALPGTASEARELAREAEQLRDLVAAVGSERVLACGPPTTSDLLTESALAWELEVGLGDVILRRDSLPPSGVALVGPAASERLRELARGSGRLLEANERWAAYAISCSA